MAETLASGPTSHELQDYTIKGIAKETVASSSKTSDSIEKGDDLGYDIQPVQSIDQGEVLMMSSDDPFPQDPNAEEEQQFTVRAVLVGCILGGVIAASK